MFERIEISHRNKESHRTNKNIRRLSFEEFSIYKYNFRVDVEANEFCLTFER